MKIIQLLARIDGSGVTRYIIELNKGLKMLGHEVEIISLNTGFKDADGYSAASTQTIADAKLVDFSDETTSYINSADLVIINAIVDRRATLRNEWIDLVQNKITTKKVIVVNDHKPAGFRAYYGDLLKNKDFWMSFNKICTFAYDARVYRDIRKTIGEEEATKRFMHLQLPYDFDDKVRENWIPFADKLRRVTYLGRHAPFKDNHRLVRGKDSFYAHNYEVEMRGIKCTVNVAITPNLKYEFDENNEVVFETEGPRKGLRAYSKICRLVTNTWKKANGIAVDDEMVYSPKRDNMIYIFDAYKRETGLDIVGRSAFGCDFFHLDYDGCYGDDFEYTVFEMIEHGAIPLLDWGAGNAIYMADENDEPTGKTALELGLGIFIKKDLSNIEEELSKMDELMTDGAKYDAMRNKIYDAFKANCNTKAIVKKFIDSIYE